jgi:hypothetical protein
MKELSSWLLGLVLIAYGPFSLYCAWQALIGEPLSLAFAPPGLDILLLAMRITAPKDANEIWAVVGGAIGVFCIVGGLFVVRAASRSSRR